MAQREIDSKLRGYGGKKRWKKKIVHRLARKAGKLHAKALLRGVEDSLPRSVLRT